MKNLKVLTTCVFAFVCMCGSAQMNDELEVISATFSNVIKPSPRDSVYTQDGKEVRVRKYIDPAIVLIKETKAELMSADSESFKSKKRQSNGMPFFENEAYLDFTTRNNTRVQIEKVPDFKGTITYVTQEEYNVVFKNGGWDSYYKKYKRVPLVRVSRPGFNKDMSMAFVYISTLSGMLSGAGYYVILEKADGKWVVKDSMMAWIS